MSLTLSLRRASTKEKDDPELVEDELEDTEDRPPVADGRQQTTSTLATKAATFGLLTCLALGPVGAAVGGLAFLQTSQPAPVPAITMTDRSNERAAVGQFAQQVVVTWLTTTQEDPDALLALIKDARIAGLSRTAFVVDDPAVAGITFVDDTWSVTVALTVTDANQSTERRYFQIPVRYAEEGLTAITLPTPVSAPPVTVGSTTGYRTQVDTSSSLGQTVGQFLSAYTAGAGDVSRYLTPGVFLAPLTPAPYTEVQLSEIRAVGEQPSEAAQDGTQIRVLALGTAVVTDEQTSNVAYALTVTARAGRWEISAIDPAPVQQQTQTPAASSATDTAPARSSGSATTTPADTTTSTNP